MSDIDVSYVSALLNIAEACSGHSGKLSNLQSWAIGELIRINGEIKEAATDAKAAAEAQQKATGLPKEPGEPEDDDAPAPTGRRL